MPAEIQSDLILPPPALAVTYELEPAQNVLYSLMLLNYAEHLSGLDDWVTRTSQAMLPERRHNNRLVLEGLHFAVMPLRSFSSFEEYLADLAASDPVVLRDRLLERLVQVKCAVPPPSAPVVQPSQLLRQDSYIAFLKEFFSPDDVDLDLEREAHDYIADPPRMHALILYHLQSMWRQVVQPEWERVRPMLDEAVAAFRSQDFERLPPVELVRRVTGQELKPALEQAVQDARRLILVPSAHVGPYLGKFAYQDTLWILFGAHLPAGVETRSTALTRAELLMRLSALTDDNRLRILELLARQGELCAQDIINQLDLSQPAVSRHLKQLSATGYVAERRRDGNKCYTLNRDRLDDTFDLLEKFLARESASARASARESLPVRGLARERVN